MNDIRKKLLLQLLPGLLPILIYIAADYIFGEVKGLIIAIGLSLLEFIFILFRQKRADKFVLFDLLLISIMGGISIAFSTPIFFKIKPAIINIILAIVLAISAFTERSLLTVMMKRFLPDLEISESIASKLRRTSKALFFIVIFHTIAIVISALYLSKEIWGFISSVGLYALLGLWFVFETFGLKFKSLYWKFRYKNSEWFDVISDDGRVLFQAPREICHKNTFYLHPVVHLQVFHPSGGIWLQKRPKWKSIQPDKWDSSVGGHVAAGENIDEALKREAFEEAGLENFKPQHIFKYVWHSDVERELVFAFITISKTIDFNKDETDGGRLWQIAEIDDNIGKGIFTPNFEFEFNLMKNNNILKGFK